MTLGADLTEGSLYRLLADNGIARRHGVRSAEATVATHEQAQHLGVSAGSALLRLRSISRSSDGTPIEYFIAYHRGDRSRFEFQLQQEQSQASLHVDGEAGRPAPGRSAERPVMSEGMSDWTSTAIALLEADANRSATPTCTCSRCRRSGASTST